MRKVQGRRDGDAPIDELLRDAKAPRHALEGEAAVGLEELVVCEDAHLADVVPCVGVQEAGGEAERLFERSCGRMDVSARFV